MIITHITSVHPRYDTRIYLKECAGLARGGHTVHLVVADGGGDEVKEGVAILDGGAKAGGRLGRMTRTVRQVYKRAVATEADLYHLHDPELLTLAPSLLKRGKVIYDAHEDLPRQLLSKHWIPKLFRPFLSAIFERVENYFAKQVSGIVTATSFIAERFEKIHPSVCTVNNFPLSEEFEEIFRQPSAENIACYVGGIGSIRGLYEMVKAMEHVDGRLLLAGNFGNPKEREIAASLHGWRKVVELGFCDRLKVKDLLSRAKVGLVLFHPYPNHVNAQPNKLFEYMAAALPVIASDFPLWREIVHSSGCGLCVDPLDTQAIAGALNWVFQNPAESAQMGERGRKAVEEKYNWRAEEKKLTAFYESINRV